jgi:hypothetical protein
MPNSLIQGISYVKLAPLSAQTYDLVPLDYNGNVFQLVTISVNTTAGIVTINLPEISTLNNNWNCKIVIVRSAGANNVVVTAGGSDKIGSLASETLTAINKSIVLNPVEEINWYGVHTA